MKIIFLAGTVLAMAVTLPAQVITTNSYSISPNAAIADGSPVGLSEQFSVGGLGGAITNIQLSLDITGGFNGDLYAYLAGPQGQMAVLLNRTGITGSNPFGYADQGFSITLDGLALNNIHDYGSGGYSINGLGQVVGTWAADGRNIDPQSAGTLFDSAGTTMNLGVFQNTDGDGTWTLFLADLSAGGGTANLNNATLSIMTVPEPSTLVLGAGGLLWLFSQRCRKQKH